MNMVFIVAVAVPDAVRVVTLSTTLMFREVELMLSAASCPVKAFCASLCAVEALLPISVLAVATSTAVSSADVSFVLARVAME